MRVLSSVRLLVGCLGADVAAQTPLTWADVLARYKANDPTLRAGRIGVEEARADEITASLRPNPQLSVTADQVLLAKASREGRDPAERPHLRTSIPGV